MILRFILTVFLFVLLMVECRTEQEEILSLSDIQLVAIEKGGCNTYSEKSAPLLEEEKSDTIVFRENGDTLVAQIGFNHLCCVLFEANVSVINDTLSFEISDICNQNDRCYCKCMCYYTFDFAFVNFSCTTIPYKATVYNAFTNTTKILFAGHVDL